MDNKTKHFDFILIFLSLALMVALGVIVWDWRTGMDDSINARITLLEEKIRPVIQIERAIVYNLDGEIAIQGLITNY